MGKYTYLFYLKWSREEIHKSARALTCARHEYYDKEWKPKLLDLCKEHGVELLKDTGPFGTVEESLYIFDTDIPLDEFAKFSNAIFAIVEEDVIEYSKTTICLNN